MSIMRKLTSSTSLLLALATGLSGEFYQPDWESLGDYEVPEWYQDAKFGIWPHWGIYSVPAYRGDHAAEWYGRWIYCQKKGEIPAGQKGRMRNDYYEARGLKTAAFHRETYGDPREFGYHDLADLWKAEKWDPDAWAQLAVDAGAKFFCMMGMHHDGFSLWDSDLTDWDSVERGPQRDLVGEMRDAVRRRGLKFGVSNHFAWNHEFFGFYHRNGFSMGEKDLAGFYSEGVVDEAYLKRWWKRTTELVDKSDCDLYYFDWGWNQKLKAHGNNPWKENNFHARFAAYLYNKGIVTGKGGPGSPGVVLCTKRKDVPEHAGVRDLERRQMADIKEHVWQTDTSISVHSWGYSTEDEYRSGDQLIDSLMDIVSKNGVMMLNFGPKADGTIPDEYKRPLLEMGAWLKVCGEAVYSTRPYSTFGEGPPLQDQKKNKDHTIVYTGEHIRFTRSKDNSIIYATALDWPGEIMLIRSFATGEVDLSKVTSVSLLGVDSELKWKQTEEGMRIQLPGKPDYGMAYPVRIAFSK